jgi:hypothetical protein
MCELWNVKVLREIDTEINIEDQDEFTLLNFPMSYYIQGRYWWRLKQWEILELFSLCI